MVDDFGGLESDFGTSIVTELEDGRQQLVLKRTGGEGRQQSYD